MGAVKFIVVYAIVMIFGKSIFCLRFSSASSLSDMTQLSMIGNNTSQNEYTSPFQAFTPMAASQKGNITESDCNSSLNGETCMSQFDDNQSNETKDLFIINSRMDDVKNISEGELTHGPPGVLGIVLQEPDKIIALQESEESSTQATEVNTVTTIAAEEILDSLNEGDIDYENSEFNLEEYDKSISLQESGEKSPETTEANIYTTSISDEIMIPSNEEELEFDLKEHDKKISLLESVESSSETTPLSIVTTIVGDDVTTQPDESVDYGTLESDWSHMILCDSPPNKFSPEFKGNKGNECPSGDRIILQTFPDVMDMCRTIYGTMYPDAQPFEIGWYHLSEDSYLAIFDKEDFVQVCSPLFERFDDCERRDFLTICWKSQVAFVRDSGCKIPSENDSHFYSLLTIFSLVNDTQCFKKACEGHLRVVDSEISGFHFRLMNSGTSGNDNSSCAEVYDGLDFVDNEEKKDLFIAKNEHWPCCFPLYLVVWVGNPEENGLSGSWDYLPYSCRVGEISLIVIMVLLAVSSVLGNLVIIAIIGSSKNKLLTTYMIRISLAVADLLKGLFIICPSLYDHASPFFTATEFTQVSPDLMMTTVANASITSISLTNTFLLADGFLMFRGFLFTTCTIASLLSLFLLSIERYLMTKQNAEIRFYFTKGRVIALLVFFWVAGLVDAILLSYDGEEGFNVMYLNFEKIPVAYSMHYPDQLFFTIVHDVQFYLFYVIGLSTLVFSLLAFRNFHVSDKRVREQWSELNMNVTGPYNEENHYIVNTMLVMVVFYLISVVPRTVDIFFHLGNFHFRFTHLFTYLSWWCFMASSAWNPWIYNMRSKRFRLDFLRLVIKMLPGKLQVRFAHYLQDPESE
ncbi:uncharacterized protein LOC135216109 [Macrobrachium nipponense]|uniref:uncharacterized protein LOC135216109 n=1 Tax=Macrobrachium nipponense TaxID=159736 RepID=UPI0030C7B5DC